MQRTARTAHEAANRPDIIGIHRQLNLFGLDTMRKQAGTDRRQAARLTAASQALSEDFVGGTSIAWTHSGWCLAGLPHSRPPTDDALWHRHSGRLHLLVEPGSVIEQGVPRSVGVPYGALARVILLYIQSRVRADGTVPLGRSISAWVKELRLPVTGPVLARVREQVLRLARARISIHWTDAAGASMAIQDKSPVQAVHLWTGGDPHLQKWEAALTLNPDYYRHLQEHRVPLADHAIQFLKGSSLALDLYLWLAYRLRALKPSEAGRIVPWPRLADQIGAAYTRQMDLAIHIASALPDVLAVYPGARVESHTEGLRLWPSPSPVPGRRR